MQIIITLSITAFILMYAGLYKAERALLPVALAGLLAAGALCYIGWNHNTINYGMLKMDNFALLFSGLCVVGTMLVFGLTHGYFSSHANNRAEYFALMLFALAGMVMMMAFENLSMLFIGIETMSVSLYVLAGINKKDTASNEAALKYFLMGAFSTGFLLFGIALLYGATGSFQLSGIKEYLINHGTNTSALVYPGVILIMAGLCFKVGAAPFHFWTPDVYDGSPSLVTAFMATVAKTAAFAAFLRLFYNVMQPLAGFWGPALLVITILTLVIGNFTALRQHTLKRTLAYSSISHAGYLLFGILVLNNASLPALFVYAAAYTFATITAFAILIRVRQATGNDHFAQFNGMGKNSPAVAFMLTIAMLSLAGIPLTGGFMGKYLMFAQVMGVYDYVLLGIAVVCALAGFYYYLRVVNAMYFKSGDAPAIRLSPAYTIVLAICTLATVVAGVYPTLFYGLLG